MESDAATVRRFNRFYTRQIGVLHEGLLGSRFSLAEARVLFELAHRERATASELVADLGLDAGYLSRILGRFERQGLIDRLPSERDRRRRILSLTEEGRRDFRVLDARATQEVEVMLAGLEDGQRQRLLEAMAAVEAVLGPAGEPSSPLILRPHRPGDAGWVTHRHGVLYAREYGWDETFEALVAAILADFLRGYDHRRERGWIAEMDGEIVGSVFVMRDPDRDTVAKLRLLLVEPAARGMGLGTRLVEECIRFAQQAGYQRLALWTNSVLEAARHIYQKTGFRLVAQESHHSYGHDLVGETWELDLRSGAPAA